MQLAPNRPSGPKLRGRLSSRQASLVLALIAALAAAAIMFYAANRYRSSVNAGGQRSTVLIAKALIQKGTSGSTIAAERLAVPTEVLERQLAAGAIANAALIRAKVAVHDILPGEQLTAADFKPAAGVGLQLGPNQRAVAVTLDNEHGLGDLLQSGDYVDVYADFNVNQQSGPPKPVLTLLASNVRVLRVNSSGGAIGSGGQSVTVLLAVGDLMAGKVAFTADNGKVWLVLRGGNAATTPPNVQDLGSVLLGQPGIATPTLERQLAQVVAKAAQ
jgi:Flp pilus assembly protein CpaB